jgi:HEAT repeat protein
MGGAVSALAEALRDSDVEVRRAAAAALGRIGTRAKEAGSALKATAAHDPDLEVRFAAARALAAISPKPAG